MATSAQQKQELFSDDEAAYAKDGIVREKGFFIMPSQLFCNPRNRAKNDPNLNVTLDNIFKAIEVSAIGTESEPDLNELKTMMYLKKHTHI